MEKTDVKATLFGVCSYSHDDIITQNQYAFGDASHFCHLNWCIQTNVISVAPVQFGKEDTYVYTLAGSRSR